MQTNLTFILLVFATPCFANENMEVFFRFINKLQFDSAKTVAAAETDLQLRAEMKQFADLLYYEGQVDSTGFKIQRRGVADDTHDILAALRLLNAGYFSLFYDRVKGDAFKNFYHAYQLVKESKNQYLVKASLLALLRYYNLEIAQNTNGYDFYLKHFERLASDLTDQVWVRIFRMIFYSKTLDTLAPEYFIVGKELAAYENKLEPTNPILPHLYYENALRYELEKDDGNARRYYKKTLAASGNYPFLRYHRFFACLRLVLLESRAKRFDVARSYYKQARSEIDKADTLRSDYHLNFFGSVYMHAQSKDDSAYLLLNKGYTEEFKLDFRRNTLEISRLGVELETQEKENANLRLRQGRNWLVTALVGVGLLLVSTYFAFANQRTKNRIQLKQREVETMKLEKMLKSQELFGIDAMIAGQEKERQRIANDLHDNLGSIMATLKLHFHSLRSSKEADTVKAAMLQKTDELLEEAYQKVRSIAHTKNAGVYAQQGLIPAIRKFALTASVINKLSIHVQENGMADRLENSLEITIFRMIQELITNIIKHSQATEATIHLTQHDVLLNIMVEDNGIGFDIHQIKSTDSMGLHTIEKRVEGMGGRVTIDTILQKGTTVILDIPLK
jgi:signal transduction histidine kinase